MTISAATPNDQKWIENQIEEVKQHFGNDIVKTRYDLDTDWVGDPTIHFRILLPDTVADDDDWLGEATGRVMEELVEKLGLPEADRYPIYSCRSAGKSKASATRFRTVNRGSERTCG